VIHRCEPDTVFFDAFSSREPAATSLENAMALDFCA